MTDEEIKQNAEIRVFTENSFRKAHKKLILTPSEEKIAKDFYVAGAHSCDEEIEELQDELNSLRKGFYERGDKLKELMLKNNELRNPWVSVEERLPEELQMVFVHMQEGSIDSAIYTNGAFERSLQLRFGMKDDGYTLISWHQKFKSNITHWMPIPELKKGEEE